MGYVRELVYLSDAKLASFLPERPPWWKRVGRRATLGIATPVGTVGVSASAADPEEGRQAKFAAVVADIESSAGWYATPGLQAGQWVQFEARMTWTAPVIRNEDYDGLPSLALFVEAASAGETGRLVLHGSREHLLEDPDDGHQAEIVLRLRGSSFWNFALFVSELARVPHANRISEWPWGMLSRHYQDDLIAAINRLDEAGHLPVEAAEWVAGYARITLPSAGGFICATPLYVQRIPAP